MLETAKFNVLTAHSSREALEMIDMFPGISGAIITSDLGTENDCVTVAQAVKKAKHETPVIFLSPAGLASCDWADHILSTYEPEALLAKNSPAGTGAIGTSGSGPGAIGAYP